VYRFRWFAICSFLLIAAMTLVASCSVKKPASSRGASVIEALEASDEYTLRIVFDGLTAFWAPNKSDQPGKILFFMGPRNPGQFNVGSKMPPHQTHLLIQSKVDSSGKEENDTSLSTRALTGPVKFPHDGGLEGKWRQVVLEGEDLTLKAETPEPLKVVRGTSKGSQPCKPGTSNCTKEQSQRELEDLGWAADLPVALDKIPQGTLGDKSINRCLTEEKVTCPKKLASQLSGRFKLEHGTVIVNDLFRDTAGNFRKFILDPAQRSSGKAQAESIAVTLKVRGPVEFRSSSLADATKKGSVVIQGRPGHTVEVHVANHPTCGDRIACMNQGFIDSDFLFGYVLLNNPAFNGGAGAALPLPREVELVNDTVHTEGSNFNGQCSPTSLIR
jgi:hypothetical protein